jgi:polyhydroxybutyrate depolymerase
MVAVVVGLALLVVACTGDDAPPGADGESGDTETAACSPDQAAEPGTEALTLTHDGVEREYLLHVPDAYDGEEASPVIVNLHGLSSTATQQDAFSNLPGAAGDRGYVVVSPQALVTSLPVAGGLDATYWNVAPTVDTSDLEAADLEAADDLGFVDALLDEVEAALCIDAERVYAAGMSNGAAMSMALACTSDRFAAVAPVAGANFVSDCETDDPPPIIGFHGTDDSLAPYDGGDVFGFPLGLPAAVDQMADLAATAGCAVEPEVEPIGEDVEVRTWAGCPDGEEIVHYTVLGGGHTWPGVTTYLDADLFEGDGRQSVLGGLPLGDVLGRQTETIVATELIVDFFDDHPA